MEIIKRNLDAISLLGHVSKDLSSSRSHRLNSALHLKCASLRDLEYTDTKNLSREGISKSLVKAKEVGGLCKQFQPETYKTLFCATLTKTRGHHNPKTIETGDHRSFLEGQNTGRHLHKIFIKIKKRFSMEMNQVKAGIAKNKLPNWQKITRNNKLLEKI